MRGVIFNYACLILKFKQSQNAILNIQKIWIWIVTSLPFEAVLPQETGESRHADIGLDIVGAHIFITFETVTFNLPQLNQGETRHACCSILSSLVLANSCSVPIVSLIN